MSYSIFPTYIACRLSVKTLLNLAVMYAYSKRTELPTEQTGIDL